MYMCVVQNRFGGNFRLVSLIFSHSGRYIPKIVILHKEKVTTYMTNFSS